jgi:glutamate dehydrogenase (NADP+)
MSDSSGFVHDKDGIDAEKLAWIAELKGKRRGRIEEYAKAFGAAFHAGHRPWSVPCDLAFPCATQNEISRAEARTLIENGCLGVSEGSNMPTEQKGIEDFTAARLLFAPSKAANAGGVAISGLEMSQNSARITWEEPELQKLLLDIMEGIHAKCVRYGKDPDSDYVDYVKGANIAGFIKVADAMIAYGVV